MSNSLDVAILGAGPYGLSLAAHLGQGMRTRVFGAPMGTWRAHMPPGMCLKSDGFACDLYDPDRRFTFKHYCHVNGIKYEDRGLPVDLETFTSYGLAFQRRFVPDIDDRLVSNVKRNDEGFRLTLSDGETVTAKQVVVAVGLTHFAKTPDTLCGLPEHRFSHSSQCEDLDRFAGQDVVVLGAGASAIDISLALHEAGARTTLITRRDAVPFHGKAPAKRSLLTRVKNPWSGLGPGWRSRLACDLPLIFYFLPRQLRIRVVQKHLGPAPGWFTRDRFVGKISTRVGFSLRHAEEVNGRVRLSFLDQHANVQEVDADHVIAGTGYGVDLGRLAFLDSRLRNDIATEEKAPILSTQFESTVPGLYFTGPCAAYSFGPLLRFAFGAGFASRRLSKQLKTRARRHARRAEDQQTSLDATATASSVSST